MRPGVGRRAAQVERVQVRAPNSARPTRTIVAPSSTATSKSSLIPIDSSREPEVGGQLAQRARTSGGGRRRAGGTVMRPATSRPSAAERVDERRHRAGRQPPFCGSSRQVHLDQHPRAGRPPGDLGAELGAVDRLPARDPRRERAHLVALELPEEVPARAVPASAGALASSSWARFSPTSTTPAATTCCDTARRRRSWSRRPA